MNDMVTCIVLNWNGGEQAVRCVKSLQTSEDVRTGVIVIDNGSTDGSDRKLRETFSGVSVVKNVENRGVAAAWNQAVDRALAVTDGPLFFLNSDAIVSTDCLSLLLKTLDGEGNAGIVTPRILDGNTGKVWFDGGIVNWYGRMVHRGLGKAPAVLSPPAPESFASGCAMLVRSRLFKTIRFDERYFAYSEDADFSIQVRQQGWIILHNPRALAVHYPSSSVKLNVGKWVRDYYVTRNSLILARWSLSGIRRLLFHGCFCISGCLGPAAYFVLTGQVRRAGAVLQGVADFLRGKDGRRYG